VSPCSEVCSIPHLTRALCDWQPFSPEHPLTELLLAEHLLTELAKQLPLRSADEPEEQGQAQPHGPSILRGQRSPAPLTPRPACADILESSEPPRRIGGSLLRVAAQRSQRSSPTSSSMGLPDTAHPLPLQTSTRIRRLGFGDRIRELGWAVLPAFPGHRGALASTRSHGYGDSAAGTRT
jgi:hypothetical protein